jgi:hypothetical protein
MMTAATAGSSGATRRSTLDTVRAGLLLILVIGLIGTEVELFFLKHTDGAQALIPVILIGVALLVLLWFGVSRSAAAIRALQALMLAFVVSGALGVWFHYEANLTDEKESDPSLSGTTLHKRALLGAMPTLAPGTMVQLGLVGLFFAFRHPSLPRRDRDGDV